MTVANHNVGYDHGPGNPTIEEAYLRIRTLRLHERAKQHEVREALLFLQAAAFDDTRCALYALGVLDELSNNLEFVEKHDNLWQVLGALSGVVLARASEIPEIKQYADSGRFKRKFTDASWPIRARLIGGFIELARRTPERDEGFWKTTDFFLQECRSHCGEAKKTAALQSLVNLWWTLSSHYGTDESVQRHVAQNAHPLLLLIQQAVLPVSLPLWYETLRNLNLPRAQERDTYVQRCLTKVAEEIGLHENDPTWRLKEWFAQFKDELMPYLHGRQRRPPRIIFPEHELQTY
jgi:hypothetical protein